MAAPRNAVLAGLLVGLTCFLTSCSDNPVGAAERAPAASSRALTQGNVQQAGYTRVLFLGTASMGEAVDMNNRGEVIGYTFGPAGAQPFRWSASHGTTPLPAGVLRGINNAGEVLIYDQPTTSVADGLGVTTVEWGGGWDTHEVSPFALLENGTIVGHVADPSGLPQLPFVWTSQAGVQLLEAADAAGGPYAAANAVNSSGTVAGYYFDAGIHAASWTNGVREMLFPPNRCSEEWSAAINQWGMVVGPCDQGGPSIWTAYVWTPKDGPTVLGPVDDYSIAFDVNNRAEVVGFRLFQDTGTLRAFRWTQTDGFTWLDQDPTIMGTANAINERGWIAGSACVPTGCHPALWIPHGSTVPQVTAQSAVQSLARSELQALLEAMIDRQIEYRGGPPSGR